MSEPQPITKGECVCFVREGKWVRATVLAVAGTLLQLDLPEGQHWLSAEELIEGFAHVSEEPLPMHVQRSGVPW